MLRRFALVLTLLLALPGAAPASLSAIYSYTAMSPDGRRLLVMLLKGDRTPLEVRLPDGRMIDASIIFSESGVYDTSTLALLWPIRWYQLPYRLQWSDDFTSVAHLNIFAVRRGPAISFFREGKMVRQYRLDELLTSLRGVRFLPYSTGDWHFVWYETFERTGNEVVLSTARRQFRLHGHRFDLGREELYTFDLSTGAMTSRRVTGAWYVWAYGAGLFAILASLAIVLAWLRKAVAAIRARRRAGAGLCPTCAYDLRASRGACPECGHTISSATHTRGTRIAVGPAGAWSGRVRRTMAATPP